MRLTRAITGDNGTLIVFFYMKMTPRFGIMEVLLQPSQNERCHSTMIPVKRTEFQLP